MKVTTQYKPPKPGSQLAESMKLEDEFQAKFGRLPRMHLMELGKDFEARIKHALETGDPGTLIRAPRKPGGMLVD